MSRHFSLQGWERWNCSISTQWEAGSCLLEIPSTRHIWIYEYTFIFSPQPLTSSHSGVKIQTSEEFGFTSYSSYFLTSKTEIQLLAPLWSRLRTIDKNSYTEVRYLNFFKTILDRSCVLWAEQWNLWVCFVYTLHIWMGKGKGSRWKEFI